MMRHGIKNCWNLLWLVAIFASAYFSVLTAEASQAPMTSMETGSGYSQDLDTRDTMGAHGLVPFGSMIGKAGKWMIGYQYVLEQMTGNLVGTNHISNSKILESFFATPTDMTMQMHMFTAMYAPTDKLTLMTMLPYIRKDMNHLTVDDMRFAERTNGIGDIELGGVYLVYGTEDLRHRFLLNGSVGLPTGSIDKTMNGMRLEYPMQIGSGTYSLLPGITYLGQAFPWGWGADFNSTVRIGKNSNDYRLGNRYLLGTWCVRQLTNWVSLSAGARGEIWGNIHGADPQLDPMDEPSKDPNLQGGKLLNALFGVNFHPHNWFFNGQKFSIQADVPVWQSLDGPQLKRSFAVHIAWQWQPN
ncbi:MAG: transporter [Gammaproteobacteria bacterium]